MTPYKIIALAFIGCTLGYLSAQHVISGNVGNLTLDNEGWTLWRKAGYPEADPYTKAHFALRRGLPMSGFEEMNFSTGIDNNGGSLNVDCTYSIYGQRLPSRTWSLYVIGDDGKTSPTISNRRTFNKDNVIRDGSGGFEISLSISARPGNWLPLSASADEFKVIVSLLNPDRKAIDDASSIKLPIVRMEFCE